MTFWSRYANRQTVNKTIIQWKFTTILHLSLAQIRSPTNSIATKWGPKLAWNNFMNENEQLIIQIQFLTCTQRAYVNFQRCDFFLFGVYERPNERVYMCKWETFEHLQAHTTTKVDEIYMFHAEQKVVLHAFSKSWWTFGKENEQKRQAEEMVIYLN